MSLHFLLASILYDIKSTVCLAVVLLIIMFLSLAAFKILPLHLLFHPLYYYTYSSGFLHFVPYSRLVVLMKSVVWSFSSVFSAMDQCFWSILSVLFLLDFNTPMLYILLYSLCFLSSFLHSSTFVSPHFILGNFFWPNFYFINFFLQLSNLLLDLNMEVSIVNAVIVLFCFRLSTWFFF